MIPKNYSFENAYRNDGIPATKIRFRDSLSAIIDLSTMDVRLSMVDERGDVKWTFSSSGDGDSLIEFDSDGSIILPEIKEWNIDAGRYKYDLQVTNSTGFVSTFLAGTWVIIPDITKNK